MTRAVVRPASFADAGAIAEVHVASWRAVYAGILPDAFLERLAVERRQAFWERAIGGDEGDDVRVFVVEDDGGVVGFASTGRARDDDLPPTAGELMAIYLSPATWGTGLGHALFDRAVSDLTERGFAPLVLWVLTDNAVGRRFYDRQGWRPDGTSRNLDFDGTPIEEIRYRLPPGADSGV